MRDEKVKAWMSRDLIIIDPTTTLPQAYQLMKKHRIRRLPVVQDGKLVGMVTLGDLREARPSEATSLSIFEMNYLLSQLKIEKIMTTNLITIPVDATIGLAASLMYSHKIGGLPVLDDDRLVGILTESDIFRLIALDIHGQENRALDETTPGKEGVSSRILIRQKLSEALLD